MTGTMAGRAWQRWKRFAHRAAEIQSLVVLTMLYWIVVVPVGLFRRSRRRAESAPSWTVRRPTGPVSVPDARRQS